MKYLFVALISLFILSGCGKEGTGHNQGLLEIAELYINYKNKVNEGAELKTKLDNIHEPALEPLKNFVYKANQRDQAFLTEEFLAKPSDETIQDFYIMRTITWSMFGEGPLGVGFVDTLDISDISYDEMLSAYYRMVFTNVDVNPIRPIDNAKTNIDLNKLGLKNDQEKSILFHCLVTAFSRKYLNHYRRSKEECNKAIGFSNTFPKINGELFYEATPPPLKDFLMTIGNGSPNKSFKAHFSDQYTQAVNIFKTCKRKGDFAK